MTPQARLQAVIELMAEIDANPRRPADGVVSGWLRGRRFVGAKDRRAIVERVYGGLRRRARLDWWIGRAGGPEPSPRTRLVADLALEGETPEALAHLLDGGPYAAPPLSPEERRLATMLHGKPLFHHDMPASVRGEYPAWIEPLLAETFGGDLAREMGALRDEAPLDLRVNTLKASREDALAALEAEGLRPRPTPLSPLGLRLDGRLALGSVKAFRDGLIEVQDEGSQLVALLLGARPGEAVVDYCAGAGGKTLAIAAQMGNKGRLVACDISEGRVARSQERLRRAGVHNVTRRVIAGDGDKWIKRSGRGFDRVLVDAPCTGTGTWRRNPDAKWHLTETDLTELQALQRGILDSAARLLKPGGRLVYATCSLLAAENEVQMIDFLDRHADFAPVPLSEVWPEAIGGEPVGAGPWLRLTPARHGTDGFFAGVLTRWAPA